MIRRRWSASSQTVTLSYLLRGGLGEGIRGPPVATANKPLLLLPHLVPAWVAALFFFFFFFLDAIIAQSGSTMISHTILLCVVNGTINSPLNTSLVNIILFLYLCEWLFIFYFFLLLSISIYCLNEIIHEDWTTKRQKALEYYRFFKALLGGDIAIGLSKKNSLISWNWRFKTIIFGVLIFNNQ